ncbi:MAG: type IV conjugative transfer system lipoprotein TraV [Rhodospirillales bacterium]|nr:type IV conjugative transfer system lipoprotein TraV [Rhodospirillales bacterium]
MTTTEIRASRRPALSALSGATLSGSTRAALVALSGVLALGGCSSGHVGDNWQCPLAAGGGCGSVAAADPAVPDGSGGPVLAEPLWRALADGPATGHPGVATLDPTPTPKGAPEGAKVGPKGPPEWATGTPQGAKAPPKGVRTGEVVARIWIAPFVDGSGVYREASHVRVVLEPAGWRLN